MSRSKQTDEKKQARKAVGAEIPLRQRHGLRDERGIQRPPYQHHPVPAPQAAGQYRGNYFLRSPTRKILYIGQL